MSHKENVVFYTTTETRIERRCNGCIRRRKRSNKEIVKQRPEYHIEYRIEDVYKEIFPLMCFVRLEEQYHAE